MSTLLLAIVLFLSLIPSAGGAQCVGDCSGDGVISINELIVGVNIALGNSPSSACPAFAGGGPVTIDRLIAAVNGALNGCTPIAGTPTATPTPSATVDPVGLIDLEPAFGVPDAIVDVNLRFARSVPLGSLLLELRAAGNPFDAVNGCRLDQTSGAQVSVQAGPNGFPIAITASTPLTIPAGDRLTCQLHVAASTRARTYATTVSGTLTPPDGTALAIATSDSLTIQCTASAGCAGDEICAGGECLPAPTPTPSITGSQPPTSTPTPTGTATSTRTVTPTATFSATPTVSPIPSPTASHTHTRTTTATVTRTATPTSTRTVTATPTRTSDVSPTPTIDPFGVIDLGPAFGVPGANTSVVVAFGTAFSIGSVALQYSFADNIMSSIDGCEFDALSGVNINADSDGSDFVVTVTPESGTVLIPAGEHLTCQFQVDASAKAGSHTASLSGTITLPDAQTIPVSSNAPVNLTCTEDINCNGGQVCDSGQCLTATPTATATSTPTPNPVALPTELFDGGGFRWDIALNGSIGDGSSDAFDGGLMLQVGGVAFPSFVNAVAELAGRQIIVGPAALSGLQVQRKIFVPSNGAFARFLEILDNPSNAPIPVAVSIVSNMGSDGVTALVATSSGDLAVSAADDFLITDDNVDGAGDPTVVHAFSGPGAALEPTAVSVTGDQVQVTFNVIVAAHGRSILMHFAAQNPSRATAQLDAPTLRSLAAPALAGMTNAERAAVANFAVPPIGGVVLFDNGSYVDTTGGSGAESDNLQASLTSLGYPFTLFTDTSASGIAQALAGASVLIIPEQENACLSGALDSAARAVIHDFVRDGHSLVVHGGAICAADLLNAVFGLSLSESSEPGLTSRTAAAANTACSGAPATLPENDGTSFLSAASLPGGAAALYATGDNASVALIPFGFGQIAFLGWDWFDAAPVGSQDGGWLQILGCIVQEVQ